MPNMKDIYAVTLTIPADRGKNDEPIMDDLPELIDIPRGYEAEIVFKFSDAVDPRWFFGEFTLEPFTKGRQKSDFDNPTIDRRQVTVQDKNMFAGIFKYTLTALDHEGELDPIFVDPGIGNGGQN